ncbi:hypothetical protein AAEP93_005889 [Penicillium crustosum]
MIVADMQVLLPAGSQNPGTHIPSSSRLVSWGLPASRIQQAFDLEDSPDIHPLLMVTCIIHRKLCPASTPVVREYPLLVPVNSSTSKLIDFSLGYQASNDT